MKNLGPIVTAVALALSVLCSFVANQVFISNINTRLAYVEVELKDSVKDRLVTNNNRLSEMEGDTKVANQILGDLSKSIREFSQNTKALTEVVIRLDQRVKTLESEK